MAEEKVTVLYICPRCMEPADEPTPCPRCGGERVAFRPGEPDNLSRKPLISPTGEVRTRAPVWWLQRSVTWIAETVTKLGK